MHRIVLALCVLATAVLAGAVPSSPAGAYAGSGYQRAEPTKAREDANSLSARSAPQPRKCGLSEHEAFDHEPDVLAAETSDPTTHRRSAPVRHVWQQPLLPRRRTHSPRGPPRLG
jgi:hypothetical protein